MAHKNARDGPETEQEYPIDNVTSMVAEEPVDDVGSADVDKFVYLNNSKVAYSICNRGDIFNPPATKASDLVELNISTLRTENIQTTVLLNVPNKFIESEQVIDEYDKQVMNMVYSMHLAGKNEFTPEDIANKMDGTINKRISPERVSNIVKRLQKLRTVLITIDCTKEFYCRKIISKGATAKLTGYLMPIKEVEITAPNGRKIYAYRLSDDMDLYEYAQQTHQIIKMPTSVIHDNKKLPDGDTTALLRNVLYMRISTIKNPKTAMINKTIRYDTLFEQLGFTPGKYKNWRKKYNELHHMTLKILEQFQANGLIRSFSICKSGKKIIGVRFDY